MSENWLGIFRGVAQRVAIENGKNLTIQPRQRNFLLRQGFLPGCQHREEFIVTKKLLSITNQIGRK